MANFGRFNQSLFNAGIRNQEAKQQDDIIFNGFGLQNKHFITEKATPRDMPSINLLTYTNPKSDGGGLLDRFYKTRTITLRGHIIGDSFEDTDARIDSLKKALSVKQGFLDWKMGDGTYRRILCTLTNSNIIEREHYDIEHGAYSLTFKAEKPFRSEKKRKSEMFAGITAEMNEDVFNGGSEYSLPTINVLFNNASGTNELTVGIGNNAIVLAGLTTTTLSSVLYGGENVSMTSIGDNSWTGTRPSTGTTITITLNSIGPACVIGGNQNVDLTQVSDNQRTGNTQAGVGIVVNLTVAKTGLFEASDVVEINSDEKTVKINGVAIDFSGKFPRLEAGVNNFNVKANGTFNADVSILFPKNYL